MQISVSGHHLDIGDALRAHIEDSLAATVEKYFGDAIEASVVMSRENHQFRADVAVHVFRGLHVRGHDVADDAYAASDIAAAHLGKRLRRHTRRLRNHHESPRSADAVPAQQYVLAGYDADVDEADDGATGADNPVIIAEDTTHIEELTVSEAVMRLDIADLPALMFRNAGSGGLNVVYRRADGNVGWIDPANG
jgi:ribosomal subunit interface protein